MAKCQAVLLMPLCMRMIAQKTYPDRNVADFVSFFQQGGRKPNRGEGKLSAAHVTSRRVLRAGELGYRLRADRSTIPLSFLLATHSELDIAHRSSIEGEIVTLYLLISSYGVAIRPQDSNL